MRLKRVTLFGFKTFADRTEFVLDADLTAVVGSNGCGKSNLVDAILWGLGEASPKHLRASAGTDVIFSGSSGRKALGFAEVSLHFENEDRALPIDGAEVMVTRKLTRSGESEYRINRTVCRQRDIVELFADSGLGRTGYSIVGQKEIDAALSASPEDRRAWVDEAAGVQRYRSRKQEAIRRLAAARLHLERTTDILRELDYQREPLREEAEIAKRYRSISASLKEVEVALLAVEIANAAAEIEKQSKIADSTAAKSAAEGLRIDRIDGEISRLTKAISDFDSDLERLRSESHAASNAVERAQTEIKVAEQRLESLDEFEASLGQETASSEASLAEARVAAEQAAAELDAEQAAYRGLDQQAGGVAAQVAKLNRELKACEAELESAKKLEARRVRQAIEAAHKKELRELAEDELAGIIESWDSLEEAKQEAEAALAAAEAEVARLRGELERETASHQLGREQGEKEAGELRRLLAEHAATDGRIRGIQATIAQHEGLAHGAKSVIEGAERGELKGRFTPVGEAISVKSEFAVAIETALGNSVNDLIVPTEREAKDAILWLKENRAGRATFQPISLMRPPEVRTELSRLLDRPGIAGRASDLVECEAGFRPVIETMLGRVLIAETLDDALAAVGGKDRPFSRIVTLDGEVVRSEGSVTGGAGERQSYGLVQRRAELAKLEKELSARQKAIASLEEKAQQRHGAESSVALRIEAIRASQKEAETAAGDAQSLARAIRDELAAAEKTKSRLERELSGLNGTSGDESVPVADTAEIEARRHELLKLVATQSADTDSVEARLQEASTRVVRAEARLEAAQRRITHLETLQSGRRQKIESLDPQRARLGSSVAEQRKASENAAKMLATATQKLYETQEKRRKALERSLQLTDEAKEARLTVQALADAAHHAELARTRSEGRKASALERLIEEYELSEEDALLAAPSVTLPPDASTIVNRLRRDLRAMGTVNLGSIDAYERVSTRYEQLEAQQNDILDGISDAEAAISELDRHTKDRFTTAFELVRMHFAGLVTRLFGGGEGSIELTEPGDVVESGVDIFVTLPGKRRQALNLLSGGERALCALAFLFSLLEVKSSPLVVLDEVDAPLDGLNVERFARLLQDYSQRSQFLVVTHNKGTISALPAWLGVTMQEPGVSTLIWFREAGTATAATA